MYTAALVTMPKDGNKCPLMDEWINKIWYIHEIQYFSVLKRKEILIHG